MIREWMKLMFGLQVSRTSFFRRGKQAYSHGLVIDLYFRKPLAIFFTYAGIAALVVLAATVLCVLGIGRLAKVGKTVVCSIAVNMVKLLQGKRSGHVKPCQSVSSIKPVVNSDANVPSTHIASRFRSLFAFPSRLVPRETASHRLVMHKGFKAFLSKRFGLHVFNDITQDGRAQA